MVNRRTARLSLLLHLLIALVLLVTATLASKSHPNVEVLDRDSATHESSPIRVAHTQRNCVAAWRIHYNDVEFDDHIVGTT